MRNLSFFFPKSNCGKRNPTCSMIFLFIFFCSLKRRWVHNIHRYKRDSFSPSGYFRYSPHPLCPILHFYIQISFNRARPCSRSHAHTHTPATTISSIPSHPCDALLAPCLKRPMRKHRNMHACMPPLSVWHLLVRRVLCSSPAQSSPSRPYCSLLSKEENWKRRLVKVRHGWRSEEPHAADLFKASTSALSSLCAP